MFRLLIMGLITGLCLPMALAKKPKVPSRQIPPAVLMGLQILQRDFARALEQDCAPERCFAKGCVYVAHTVVDQAATGGLPGLHLKDAKDDDAPSQVYLTTAECSFAHEKSVRGRDAAALATRLKAKLSKGWTQVDVVYEKLKPLPAFIRESPEPPPEPPPPPEPDAGVDAAVDAGVAETEEWSNELAGRELWVSLLPHFSWMIALIMLTFAGLIVIWALRRLGRASPEEQALLAAMLNEANEPTNDDPPGTEVPVEHDQNESREAALAAEFARWRQRLDEEGDDPALQALVSDLLRNGERRVLAKAVMLFPEAFPPAFPQTGTLASAKFEVATLLKHADPDALPSDEAFFSTLNRYALAASLTAHSDTDLIRSLHDEFGASALMTLLDTVPTRYGALLFALVPDAMQHEAVGLLSGRKRLEIADQLLRSNRMDAAETTYLLDVLAALRADEALPAAPSQRVVSDRGTEFNATGALSVLLPRLTPEARAQLVDATAARLGGKLPGWVQGTLYAEMLLKLEGPDRTDLLLEVDTTALSAWLQAQTPEAHSQLIAGVPTALRAALGGSPAPSSQDAFYALVNDGRVALASALQRRLLRGDLSFQALLA
jgi:hypothetical protein